MAENEGFMGGLASGLQQGTNMGYMALQARAMRDNQIRQAQMMEMEQKQAEFKKQNAMLERGVDLFKSWPKRMRPDFFNKQLKPLFESVYGISMKDVQYNDVIAGGIEDLGDLIKLRREGKISQDEFLLKAAELRSMVSPEESTQIGGILSDLPGISSGGGQSSFTHVGWDKNNQPIFTNNKSTKFFDSRGKPVEINKTNFTPKNEDAMMAVLKLLDAKGQATSPDKIGGKHGF